MLQSGAMPIRFRRSFKLFPGIRLNLSRSGVSTTVGVPGAHRTFGPRGTRTTIGIPGSGLSISETAPLSSPRTRAGPSAALWFPLVVAAVLAVCFALGALGR